MTNDISELKTVDGFIEQLHKSSEEEKHPLGILFRMVVDDHQDDDVPMDELIDDKYFKVGRWPFKKDIAPHIYMGIVFGIIWEKDEKYE